MNAAVEKVGSHVLGTHIDALSWTEAETRIMHWVQTRQSRYICICNVHSVVTGRRGGFQRVLNEADMTTPDGMPLVWWLRRAGFQSQERIEGPELMLRLCALAARSGTGVFLYGGSESTLAELRSRLPEQFPGLRIAGAISPPYRPMRFEEDWQMVQRINESGAGLVFVGLGCPKQEAWMWEMRGTIRAVMVGVGAAFDFHAGRLRRAPRWMQRAGLEWLYRLLSEPRRLWRRYLVTNATFLWKTALDCLRGAGPRGKQNPAVRFTCQGARYHGQGDERR